MYGEGKKKKKKKKKKLSYIPIVQVLIYENFHFSIQNHKQDQSKQSPTHSINLSATQASVGLHTEISHAHFFQSNITEYN